MDTKDMFSYYLTININSICRVCLEKPNLPQKLTPIFDSVKPPHFSNLIMACAAVQVLDGDGLPSLICNKCIARLNVAYNFKLQCESSDLKLRNFFSHPTHHISPPPNLTSFDEKTETLLSCSRLEPSEKSYDSNISQRNNGHLGSVLSNLSPKNEPLMENTLQEISAAFSEHDSIVKIAKRRQVQNKTKRLKRPVQHQCDTCGKIFRTKPSLVHHIRIHTGERPYVCHLCEKRFINGGHLHTHMRTHTGEKNHHCTACSKSFATAQQLSKHTIAIHTSERPYACSYCVKRFASSSNLSTHVRIHTGVKDYHCDQCTKAFSTKGQLLQHMLVHTGEKAFKCDVCNKRFSQKAHLVRHSKMHKV